MGSKLSKRLSSKKDQPSKGSSPSSSSWFLMEMMKPECLKRKQRKRRQIVSKLKPPEEKIAKAKKVMTLQDWLMTSPASQPAETWRPEFDNSRELHVFKQFSKRVHPSAAAAIIDEVQVPEAAELAPAESSLMSGGESGRQKKRVSFKLPEEADIITFYSPEDHE